MTVHDELVGDWKVLFTLEHDVEDMQYTLGGFICFFWPVMFKGENAQESYDAMTVMMEAAGVDPAAAGFPDLREIQRFLTYTDLRSTLDNKATKPMVIGVPEQLSRDRFHAVVASAGHEKLKHWRDTCTVSWGSVAAKHTARRLARAKEGKL